MSFCAFIPTCTCTRTLSSSSLFQACLSYITPAACRYLCYWEAVGAITPSSGCFNMHEKKNMGSALHTLHQHMTTVSPCELFVPQSCTWSKWLSGATSLFNHSDLSVTLVTSQWLLCLTVHLCIDSAYLCKHVIDSPVCSLYALIALTSHNM